MSSAASIVTSSLDPDANALIEQSRERGQRHLRQRARRSAIVSGAGFVAAAVGLALLVPSGRSPAPAVVVVLVVSYALMSQVKFEVGTGFAVPTQLVLVPMLFLLPLGRVPLAVAAGLLAGRSVEYVTGRTPLDHVLLVLPNCWYAVGPVLVLALAGEGPPRLARWPLYLAALGAQFLVDYCFSAGRELFALGASPLAALPYMGWAFVVDGALAPVGLLAALAAGSHPVAVILVLPLAGLLGIFARERQVRIDHALELSSAYRGTALLLGDVVEADDAYTGSHSRDVVSLVLDVSDRVGLGAGDRRDAELAALLHDVGKIRIPGELINKPGPLTPAERELVETHTVEGERMLAKVGGLLGSVGGIVRSCHEDWDGNGYPDGLRGEEIPLAARIVRTCDAFSAMTTDRPYRQGRTAAEALAELRRCSGTEFDPEIVEALAASVETHA